MPEEENTVSAPEEANPQQLDPVSSEDDFEALLAGIPGLDQYFGDEKSETPATEEGSASADEPTVETPAVEAEPAVEAGEAEKEKDGVQKRIDKLTAQKYAETERANALEAKVKELELKVQTIAPLAPTADSPLADIGSVEELNQRMAQAHRVKIWALEHLDGGEVEDGKGGSYMMPGDKVKHLLAQSEGLLTKYGPERRQYLQAEVGYEQEARAFYPDLYKAGTEYNQTLLNWVKAFPEVRKFPDYQIIIADALAGQKMRLAKKAAKGRPTASAPPALAAPNPSSGNKVSQKSVLSRTLLDRIATDRSALDIFSESLIGKGS
jgi:hypothetical protein